MAEVGQRLAGGAVHRLSALRNSHGVPAHAGASPAPLVHVSRSDVTVQPECQRVSERRTTRRKSTKLCAVGAGESAEGGRRSGHVATVEPRLAPELRVCEAAVFLSVKRLLHEQLLNGRMASWTRGVEGGESIHPGAVRCHQQLRTSCTITLILAGRPGRLALWCPKPHPRITIATRGYSWRRGNDRADVPPMYRSKTAYYDILKVSPSATQAQIKTAYYKQSFIYHPDKNPGSETATQRFSEISEAYTVLGNITLRRKYDRGLLSQSDLQSAGKPSSKAASRSPGATQQQQQQQHQQQSRQRRFPHAGEKVKFDFDAFYQAHYGVQLQREKEARDRRRRMQEQQEKVKQRTRHRLFELSMVMFTTGLVFVCLVRP